MIQKYIHIPLAILLLVGSSGFIVNSHFCGEALKSLTMNAPSHGCCDKDEMPTDCCHDVSEYFMVDEFQAQVSISQTINAPLLYVIDYFIASGLFPEDTSSQLFVDLKSPPLTESKIFIRIQSFLI